MSNSYKQFNRETGKWQAVIPEKITTMENRRPKIKYYATKNKAENVVYAGFKKKEKMANFEVQSMCPSLNINTIRVCISRLMRKGLLIKTGESILDALNNPHCIYQLKSSLPA